MKIQRGQFRGRRVEAPPGVRGHSEFTPGLVKEALFQRIENLIGEDASAWSFFDMCAGSGQIAMEAASRGFGDVHACEIDQKRFAFLLEQVKVLGYPIRCHRKDFTRLARLIKAPSVVFLDLPYSFWKPVPEAVAALIRAIDEEAGPAPGEGERTEQVLIFLQGPEPYPGFQSSSYGSTVLSWTIRTGHKKFDRIGV